MYMLSSVSLATAALLAGLASAAPAAKYERNNVAAGGKPKYEGYYDVQGHRGTRGEAVESTLAAFAWGLTSGATTLEMDNGITKDGHVIVWHDEVIDKTKCKDTAPVTPGDPVYPYVGKHIANLTLAQIKTLDCGSLRLQGYPQQLTYPGIKLSTMQEVFDFVKCTKAPVLFNIESKVNPIETNSTRRPEDFAELQLKAFKDNGVVDRVTYQSFDWRTLKLSKKMLPELKTSALAADNTIHSRKGAVDATSGPSDWLAGLNIDYFEGDSVGAKLVQAAHSIGAEVVSPSAGSDASAKGALDPSYPGYVSFVNASMVDTAHKLGMVVKPWTVDSLNTVEQLDALGVDGIITDYPEVVRRWADLKGYKVAPRVEYAVANKCFKKHAQFHGKVPDLL